MTIELLRPGDSNISCTEGQCAFSSATELKVSIEKKDKVFLKRLQLVFNLFVKVGSHDRSNFCVQLFFSPLFKQQLDV